MLHFTAFWLFCTFTLKKSHLIVSWSNSNIFCKVLTSLATDAWLHSLVTFFIYFVFEEVKYLAIINCSLKIFRSMIGHAFLFMGLIVLNLFAYFSHHFLIYNNLIHNSFGRQSLEAIFGNC